MNKQETESLLRYMMSMYPNVRMTDQQFAFNVQMWAKEFENDSCETVGAAFRIARSESPDWMPSIPKIQNAMRAIADEKESTLRLNPKLKEQEFMDSHCGKTESEWKALREWEESSEGRKKIDSYKLRLSRLLGGCARRCDHDNEQKQELSCEVH